jgi:hypothetical protein
MSRITEVADRYGRPRSQREELQQRLANLRMRARWSDRDDATELEQQIAEVETELRAFDRKEK